MSDKKHVSRGHSSSKLTSRHDSRKYGVSDGRVAKKHGGLGYASRNKSMEKGAKESRLLNPPYFKEDSTPATSVEDTKPQDQVKTKEKLKSVVTPTERYNELSPLMTKMVEEELKNIMINVWQTLPGEACNDADALFVDKLKGSAGDDLRNTIGLNITKRLLNVHNGILVKVVIHSAVEPSEIQAFAKKHHITHFKHVQRWTYAGRLASWTELDDLYAHKNLKCGSSSVTVSPVYSFIKCPTNLRTIFDGKQNYSHAKKIEQEAARRIKKVEGRVIVTADKVLAEVARKVIANKDKVTGTKVVKDNTEQRKIESASKSKTEATKNVAVAKNTVEKPVTKKTSDHKQPTQTDIVRNKTPKANEIKTVTKVANVKTANAIVVKKEVIPESQAIKVETVKPFAKKPLLATNTPKQNVVAPQVNASKVESVKTVAQKPVATISSKKTIVPPKTSAVKAEATKSVANDSVATNKVIASQKPITAKVDATKAAVNKPAVTTNSSGKNIISPKPETEASKAFVTIPKVSTNTPKKEIVPPKSTVKKPVVTAKDELAKASLKETAKPVINKPVTPNTAKKEILTPKSSEVKKPEVKAAKVEPTKAKIQPKAVNKPATTPRKETMKPKPTGYKKPDTKFTKVAAKPKTSNITAKVKAENDFDELDDHDILALLSSGIVLDECSGSDED